MENVVGIKFNENDKIHYYLIGTFFVKNGYNVIVKTDRGLEFAKIVTDVHKMDTSKLNVPLESIHKVATKDDYYTNKKNIADALIALKKCQSLVKKYNLNMNVISASYTFDKDQLMFKFYADNRVDFRDLAKDLAGTYKTRIELRQIGVRDKAKEVGGYGLCGQQLCCKRFLNEFNSVSISMAKNQNLSLNPTKINGICGRLLCCLKYEDDGYKECRKGLPTIGQTVTLKNGIGKVISVDVLKKSYRVLMSNNDITEVKVDETN